MNILILSHERSLNKSEGLLNAYKNKNVFLVVDLYPDLEDRPYLKFANHVIVAKGFNVLDIVNKVPKCDIVWCISENLLPIQSQLESYYGINNLTPFAAEVLSNKQKFDDYCRLIGLGEFVPNSITPTFYKQLDIFKNSEIFTKPDIGTGSNVFLTDSDQNVPKIEYRRWNNKHHFLKHLKDTNYHNEFFDLNKQGIHNEKFNLKPCKIMVQEYFWSEEPSIAPVGFIKNGNLKILFYAKMSKVKYGDILDPTLSPIETHSVSKNSDIAKDRAVWMVTPNELSDHIRKKTTYFLETLLRSLNVRDMFFVGPDFHINKDKLIGIDFNPRPGHFMNILDRLNNNSIVTNLLNNKEPVIESKVLWGCAVLRPGKIKEIKDLSTVSTYFNKQNTTLKPGMTIPEFQNIQNKMFNVNFDISGNNEQELFEKYKQINQLLQNCIIYE